MEITTKEEQDEIWEEFSDSVRYCIDSSDGSFDLEEFFSCQEDYIILRKTKESEKK